MILLKEPSHAKPRAAIMMTASTTNTTGLLQELARYLQCHHGQQEGLPMDLLSLHRRIVRGCAKAESHAAYPALCKASGEALAPLLRRLADRGSLEVDTLQVGERELVMLTRVHEPGLAALLQAMADGEAAGREGEGDDGQESGDPERCKRRRRSIDAQEEGARVQQSAHASAPTSAAPLAAAMATSPSAPASASAQASLFELLSKPTAMEASMAERFKKHASSVREFCLHGTKEACDAHAQQAQATAAAAAPGDVLPATITCPKLHFRRVIESHTDVSLGDCAYLSTCRRTRTCKYIHYAIEEEETTVEAEGEERRGMALQPALPSSTAPLAPQAPRPPMTAAAQAGPTTGSPTKTPAQWVNADVRRFDLSILGQFAVIMADPPWEIHMDLPYGTMSDDEVCKLNFPRLQEEHGGLLFLWVTGRAMERARQIFDYWGYRQVEEILWVKTNQLQKVIRTGRTGHWLNHSKEHCLVGVKGHPKGLNRYLDCDVIVAEARETSRKPDEIYDVIERISPGTRKVEIFGRRHNIRDGWVTVGNQLPPTHLVEPDVVARYEQWRRERAGATGRQSEGRSI